MPYQTFFKQFRAGFIDNLRKRGDILAYKNDQQLTQDETMSPTLEASIVLWALERIDARLPKKVKKNYGHQMVGNQCLVSLQPTIFQNIGNMLLELDEVESAQAARCTTMLGECNILSSSQQSRAPYRPSRGRASQQSRNKSQRKSTNSKRFCRICYHSGASPTVFTSHSISQCSFLTKADKVDLRSIQSDEQEMVGG